MAASRPTAAARWMSQAHMPALVSRHPSRVVHSRRRILGSVLAIAPQSPTSTASRSAAGREGVTRVKATGSVQIRG